MKKILVIIIILAFYMLIGKITIENDIIPEEAIRIRVIANSDSENDQKTKEEIRMNLEEFFSDNLEGITKVEMASLKIEEIIPETKNIISNLLGNNNYAINYGMNYFPKKEYKGIIYDEGYYKSLVVTLGSGNGKNWWCVLFPPLCLLDSTEIDEVEYRSLVVDIINKYF